MQQQELEQLQEPGAGAAGASAGAGAAAGVGAAAAAAWPVLIVILVIIVIIIIIMIVVGIVFFFNTMPGMVVGKIGEGINNFRKGVEDFFNGENAAQILVDKSQINNAAEYLETMGYDLEGYGFLDNSTKQKASVEVVVDSTWADLKEWWTSSNVNDVDGLALSNFSFKTAEERKKEDSSKTYAEVRLGKKFSKDVLDNAYTVNSGDKIDAVKNKIEDIKSNILLIRDEEGNLRFVRSKYLAMYLSAENAIYLVRNQHQNIGQRAANLIGLNDPEKGSGLIYFVNKGDKNIDDYVKNGSSSGVDFVSEDGLFNTDKVKISRNNKRMVIKNSNDGLFTSSDYSYNMDGWSSKYGVPLQLSLALHLSSLAPDFAYKVAERGMGETAVEMALIKSKDSSVSKKLYIDLGNGKNYYNVVFDINNTASQHTMKLCILGNGVSIKDIDANNIPDNVVEAITIANGDKQDAFDFLVAYMNLDINVSDFTKYVPLILSVSDHWYQDISFKDCYEWIDGGNSTTYGDYVAKDTDNDLIKEAAKEGLIAVEESSGTGSLKQIADAKKVGEAGEWITNLIDNNEYYKYDGIGKSDKKSKIDFSNTAVDAIAMLEQIQGEDAQAIIRMFKELMAKYKIHFYEADGTKEKKELFAKVIKDYNGKLLTDGEDCVYKAEIKPAQTGFEVGKIVQSPCKGEITYRTDDAVCIEINEPKKTYNKYTILISGFKVDEDMSVGSKLDEGTELGTTIKQDLKLVLRDENGAIVKNNYVISKEEETTNQDGEDTVILDPIDNQTAQTYGYTTEELNTIYAVVAHEGGLLGTNEALAITSSMMFRVIHDGTKTSDGVHYNAYKAATADNAYESYLKGYYLNYLPGGEDYSAVSQQLKSAVNAVLSKTSISELPYKYYFFLGKDWEQEAKSNCKSGTSPVQITPNGNWFYNNDVSAEWVR